MDPLTPSDLLKYARVQMAAVALHDFDARQQDPKASRHLAQSRRDFARSKQRIAARRRRFDAPRRPSHAI